MRVVVLDDYQGVALSSADWSPVAARADVDVCRDHIDDPDELVARLGGAEVVVLMRERTPVGADLLDRLPALRLVVTTGPRNAAVDVAACRARGVAVCGTGGYVDPTTELTWGLILAVTKRIPEEAASVRAGGWQRSVGTDLAGKTLGVVGLGRIGAGVAQVAAAFGMSVIAWSQNLTAARAAEAGAELVGKADLFGRADVVTLHLVLGDRTRGIVGPAELAAMKPTAFLVNTSRGPLVDEPALVAALERGAIAGAGLDVFEQEPLPAAHPFRTLPNVVATPHIGYVTAEMYALFYREVVEDIAAFLDGGLLREVPA
ncbi:MAG TPA: D-2-hydroxyacid dehydrogenase family protein [Acidimicrobiales bacterium]|nr:D-2-hydroxyacid dehydrogenase family protein [Acidimicrobiales bacterium]